MEAIAIIITVIAIGFAIRYPKKALAAIGIIFLIVSAIMLGGIRGAMKSKTRNVN